MERRSPDWSGSTSRPRERPSPMKLRFLQTTDSDVAEFPFMPGQVIALRSLSEREQAWLDDGRAEVVLEEPELATVAAPERAVLPKGKRRK